MSEIKSNNARAWYTVFISAVMGCSLAAAFPQFSMTVGDLALKSGISESVLLSSDMVKSCGIVASMLVAGIMYNRFGAKKLFVYAALISIAPQVILPHISQVWLFMLLKFLQGTTSVIFPVFLVIIMDYVEEKNVGLATAVFNGIFYSGGGIGGTFSGFVIAKIDWTASFYAIALVQLLISIVWLFTVREKPRVAELRSILENSQSPDSGTALERSQPAELENILERSQSPDSGTALERSQPAELKNILERSQSPDSGTAPKPPKHNLLLTSKVWLLAISLIATTWTVQAITVDMPLFTGASGFSEIETGKILTAVTIGMIVSCLVSGKVSDFFAGRAARKDIGRLAVLLVGYILVVTAVIFIAVADTGNFSVMYVAALILTFGSSWGLGAFYSILPEIYDEGTVPVVTGITGGIGDAGMPLAPLVVGVIFGVRGMWEIGWGSCAVMSMISISAAIILIFKLRKNA